MSYGPGVPLAPARRRHRWVTEGRGIGADERCAECGVERRYPSGWRINGSSWRESSVPRCGEARLTGGML